MRAFAGLLIAWLALAGAAWAEAPVTVVDDAGRRLELAQPARRVISLAPHLSELMFSLGAGSTLVGVSAYSDYPEAAQALPRVGDSAQLDLERLLALRPDLILVWRDGTPAQQIRRLQALGIPLFFNDSLNLAGIPHTLRRLGQLSGHAAQGEARARAFEEDARALRLAHAGRSPLRVFYQIWHQPLMTVNAQHLISEALALCAGVNVFGELSARTPTVGLEDVLLRDPDVIVTGRLPGDAGDPLALWRRLSSLRAARAGNLLEVNPDTLHRQSVRVLDGARELCAQLDRAREQLRRMP